MQPSSWTDDNLGPHPEQVISILWRSETSSNIGGSFAPCSICPPTRSVAAARSEEFGAHPLTAWPEGGRWLRGLREVRCILHASVHAGL